MKDIVATALLTVAAVLGCVRFVEMFADRRSVTTWDQVTTTVGVTAFLTASGLTLERGGIAAAALLLLLAWLVHDMVRRHSPSKRTLAACTWLSMASLLVYIALD
ncbi:hypothetical protein [Methylobacterium oxalidis]|uniref:Uncharacterized protein n=1 Tax=Methylobacterium oxalidis TaxID=944322 RepID=A0A512JB59_9HYPH|nr:hypothetical protein [Methylobacterium oxalidis]GEP07224.1 hypothetical protein MOX02_52620 [Methylobacterium oxalidis]GJE34530.1 hypothetical protein LDDCCGHA_4742 [Methylobacterium oxalidis]GLS67626.1 hypothetical protein GCM10007888_60100 [Methylobacterium oxalidis]